MSDKDLYVLHGGEEINYSLGRRKYKVYMAEQWEGEHGYAPKNHDHDDEYSKLGHTHTGIGDIPDHNHDSVYSKLGHNHNDAYSKLGHSHSEFSLISHNHDMTYSKLEHDHDDTYSKLGHVHDYAASNHNHDDVYSKLGHSHELIDMLPVGTVLWFGQDVKLSNKWVVYEALINRYPMGTDIPGAIGESLPAGVPEIYSLFAGVGQIDSSSESVMSYASGAIKYAFDGDDADNSMHIALGVSLSNEGNRDDVFSFRASRGQLKPEYVNLTDRELAGYQSNDSKYVSSNDSVYGKANTVRPDTLCLIPYIKIA